MDPKAQSAANRVYQDFEPFFEWTEDEGSATLVVMLPGFIKDQLRVQVTSTGVLKINGERQVIENIWRRFSKEFSIPSYCDTNEVGAKFERGILTVKFPKLITPAKPLEQEAITNPPAEEASMPQHQSAEPQAPPQVVDKQEEKEKIEKVVDQIEPKPTSDEKEKEKNKTEEVAPDKNVSQEKVRTNGVSEITEVKTPKSQGKPQAKMTQRLKTRLLDFNISLRSADDQNVNQGICGTCNTGPKKRKALMNVIVAILLVMVIGVYVKNAFRSSSSYQGEPKFQEL